MPTVYRVIFSGEDSPTQLDLGLAAAATTDGADRGRITAGGYQGLLVDGQVLPLPHPAEMSTLLKHGETFLTASLKGRYLQVTQRLCLACGELFDAPRLSFAPAAGCLPALLAGGVALYLAMGRGYRDLVVVSPLRGTRSVGPGLSSSVPWRPEGTAHTAPIMRGSTTPTPPGSPARPWHWTGPEHSRS